jgi:ATP-binding cassette, subfamily B, bacterial MsbA
MNGTPPGNLMTIPQGLKRVFRYGLPYWKVILVTFIAMIVYAAGINGRAYIIKPFLEEVILPAQELKPSRLSLDSLDISELKKTGVSDEELERNRQKVREMIQGKMLSLMLFALGVVGVIPLTNFIKEYAAAYVVNRMVRDLQCDLCDKFLHQPLSYHNKAQKGEIYARMNSDVARTAGSFTLIFGDMIQEPITLLIGFAAMFYLSWQLTCLLIFVVPVLVLLIVRFGKKVRKKSLYRQQRVGDMMEAMVQMFSGIKVVKAFRMEEEESRRFREVNDDLFRREMKVVKTQVLSKSITEFFNNLIYLLFLTLGVFAILKAMLGLTLPILVAFMGLTTTLYRPMKNLSRAYNTVSDSMSGVQRVCEVLDLEPDLRDRPDARELAGVREGIRFERVSFSYGRSELVLKEIDLEIRRGETVALVGRTGVGKTTLSDLIPRFYDPTQGRVLVDGIDLRELSRDSLLSHIAVVTQEPFLFDTTIEANILYGRPGASGEEIQEAAKAAYIHEKILTLPEGYQTRVGDRGARLSGGERQRVTIARAILRNASILILDEATSSLDAESESSVKMAIDNLMQGRTTVVIAHRLSTIRNADRIVVLEEGRITAIGKHEELLRREGLYRELCSMQFQNDEPVFREGTFPAEKV